ncbi:VTT domain-containing protein [Aneurinibacillus sp. Ricciae_BoGa-3]|uniref:VTT domain-containing protein n=1 Tax=Aneurinibacillus sp. Ricciae_BoGa-3 TaxID=3022697 RepID=UPI00234095AD|nr:VTT domain-containing protein [Aneurinibacillus sp. Ricciae_BoGa-3]WCK52934.1 VTT domain-containing protein [Aneurinibacillus sp. Ricciae_BoGa-3]
MGYLTTLMNHYGYIVLLISFTLELIAVPVPGEVLMGYTGVLVFQGKLNWILSIFTAWIGCCIGISIAYWIGFKLGTPFFKKYGHKFHMGPEKLEKTSQWFEKYGNKMLIIAYFIPGVRHITGYFSGITRIRFRTFALYAYLGALLYTGTFISLGKVLGPQWEHFHNSIKKYLLIAGIIAAVVIAVVYAYKKHKERIKEKLTNGLSKGIHLFHSLRRVRLLILAIAAVFLGLVVFMGGLIQDYLSSEFEDFNAVVSVLVSLIFDKSWIPWMDAFGLLASAKMLWILGILTFVWVCLKGKERVVEAGFLVIAVGGGELWKQLLRHVFTVVHPSPNVGSSLYPFPNEQTLMATIVYGFTSFVLARASIKPSISILVSLLTLLFLFVIGLNGIYFGTESPSGTVAGYVFGGVWLSLTIFLMEIFRLLKKTF